MLLWPHMSYTLLPKRAWLFLALVLVIGCSQSSPEILSYSFKLVRIQGTDGEFNEYISFFVLAQDEDGIADLDELYLINDDAQLYWHLNRDNWTWIQKSGENWVGAHHLQFLSDEQLPETRWRVILIDKSGERDEQDLRVSIKHPSQDRPEIHFYQNDYEISSSWDGHTLIAYDEAGKQLGVFEVKKTAGKIRELKLPEDSFVLALWAEDADKLSGYLTAPFAYKKNEP